jgi:hypothetical protein
MSDSYNPAIIPIYLEASSKEQLIELMYVNNSQNGKAFNYFQPFKDGKKWVVWFYADINTYRKVEVE